MNLGRRDFVKAGVSAAGAAGSLLTAPAFARASAARGAPPALVVYDSRLPASRAFAQSYDAPLLDVAHEHGSRWRGARARLPEGRIVGLTRWSDFVLMRGFAGEQLKRTRTERRLGDLRYWELG